MNFKKTKIGTVAVASPVNDPETKKRIDKSLKILSNTFDADCVKGDTLNLADHWNAGTADERVRDFMKIQAISDMVFIAKGGYGSLDIIEKIDYKKINKNVKFIGFSDITGLLLAIYSKTGIVTYHGPVLNKISEIEENSLIQLKAVLTGKEIKINLSKNSQKAIAKDIGGICLGGNLSLFAALAGTEFLKFDNKKDYVFFFEDTDQSAAQVDFLLRQTSFRLPNIIKNNVKAVILGNFKGYDVPEYRKIQLPVEEVFKKYFRVPVIKTDLFGHGQKKFITFPIGAKMVVKKDLKELALYLENE